MGIKEFLLKNGYGVLPFRNRDKAYYKMLEDFNRNCEYIREDYIECGEYDDEELKRFEEFCNLSDDYKVFIYAHKMFGQFKLARYMGVYVTYIQEIYKFHPQLQKFKNKRNKKGIKYSNKKIEELV